MKIIFILISIMIVQNCNGQNFEKDSVSTENRIAQNYPWNELTTKTAISAIEKSINNLKLPKKQRDKFFPEDPGPYSVPFTQFEIVEFEIIGYSFGENEPDIYQIEFRPKDKFGSGNRITVEINIKTNKVRKVYMQADA